MRARISERPDLDGYELRIDDDHVAGVRVEDDRITYERKLPGAEVRAVLFLSRGEVDAIARAFQQVTQAGDATIEALADTRHVRDRLLSLIEREWRT